MRVIAGVLGGTSFVRTVAAVTGLFALVLTLHCATTPNRSSEARCEKDSDCASGESCAHDFGGSHCLVACDVSIADGHDPRCPPGDTCWQWSSHSAGNVCRRGESMWRRSQVVQDRYLREHDAGGGHGIRIFAIDGDEVIDYRFIDAEELFRDR